MKRLFLFILTTMFILCVATAEEVSQAEDAPAPRIKFDKQVWDFGRINQVDKISHVFRVMNAGNADLIIERLRPDCGCTLVKASTGTLRPGESSEIEVTFTPKGYRNVVSKYIYVESNDPQRPREKLTITGEVKPPFIEVAIDVKINNRSSVFSGDKETVEELVIRNRGNNDLKIRKIKTSSSRYKIITSTDSVRALKQAYCTLKVKPRKKRKKPKEEYIYLEIAIPIEKSRFRR